MHEDDVGINNRQWAGSNVWTDKSGGKTGLKEISAKIYYLARLCAVSVCVDCRERERDMFIGKNQP